MIRVDSRAKKNRIIKLAVDEKSAWIEKNAIITYLRSLNFWNLIEILLCYIAGE